jgi:hypothetical protein
MANWLLDCKNCSEAFAYSVVPDTLNDYYLPSPPAFPVGGRERERPHCKTKSTYYLIDLRFKNGSVQPISANHR